MMDEGHTCSECGKKIEGEDLNTAVLWAWKFLHYACYKIQTKPLDDEIKRIESVIRKKSK